MKTTAKHRGILIAGFILIAFNILFLIVNGLFMLVVPKEWYDFVPGVSDTGFFNQHFIRDIGMIQIFLGAAFGIGLIRPAVRFELWAAATVWLIGHAVFHLWEVAVGICSPSVLVRDFPAVTLPALIGVALTGWAWRNQRVFHRMSEPGTSVHEKSASSRSANLRITKGSFHNALTCWQQCVVL